MENQQLKIIFMKKIKTITAVAAASILSLLVGCSDSPSKADRAGSKLSSSMGSTIIHSSRAFTKVDARLGSGATARTGQSVSVHYTGWIYDPSSTSQRGKQFDSSRTRGRPFSFPLGAGKVIKGWDQGVVGMKVGGQRTLIIPSNMAYGARGAGRDIPPHATLIFDVELLDIR